MKNLCKKILVICGVILAVSAVTNLMKPEPAMAFSGSCRNFLGMTSWDCGVNISNEESLKSGIWQIVANVLTDVTVIAAYLVVGFVIYGGYLYIASSGDPSKTAAGRKTLTRAFIGLAIVMSANIIMSTIRIILVKSGDIGNCLDRECVSADDLVLSAIHWVTGITGLVSAIFVLIGGISFVTSTGDPSKVQKARNTIIFALIGLVIVALAEIITAFVSSRIREANNNAYINQTIAKEVYEDQIN